MSVRDPSPQTPNQPSKSILKDSLMILSFQLFYKPKTFQNKKIKNKRKNGLEYFYYILDVSLNCMGKQFYLLWSRLMSRNRGWEQTLVSNCSMWCRGSGEVGWQGNRCPYK